MIYVLGFSAIAWSRLCKIDATKRKIEHIPNITVMGKASTFKDGRRNVSIIKKKRVLIIISMNKG